MNIEQATIVDLAEVITWLSNADESRTWAGPRVTYPLQPAQLAAEIMFCQDNSYCLKHDNGLAGFGQLIKINEDCYHLARIITNPQCRGQGVARQLCSQLINLAWQRGADILSLNVYRHNQAAIAIYQSLGFKEQIEKSDETLVYMLLGNDNTLTADN
ncbi:GNAT family N-acetyltransferase [Arsukibacterium indicum]|uniref:GNAT family N-acetyltransferase n=1 Tax=Arsukibacterium indicum TaxID=2848612 RepID=A0ABS6MLI2_9GAMM|nr:GNAT family N-acetyltransferase [Arsukibacterium indicum]MBV2129678.1 GNAT family N-acetyltransferase [Arsukibacterium indicum]